MNVRADRVTPMIRNTDLPPAPSYGGPERDAINAVIDKSVQNVCDKIDELHKTLDEIRQDALERNAAIKCQLQDHVTVTQRINDEIVHMGAVIAELRAATPVGK